MGQQLARMKSPAEIETLWLDYVLELAREAGVRALPVYAVSEDPAATILDAAATLGIDLLMVGAPQRHSLALLLKGNVVNEIAKSLPTNIQLIIHG